MPEGFFWPIDTGWLMGDPVYKWMMEFNPAAEGDGGNLPYRMVPAQLNDTYGDLKSSKILYGQNSQPPSEKVFGYHRILKALPIDNVGPVPPAYYDPSYGKEYGWDKTQAEISFENNVVYGYRLHFDELDAPSVFRVKSADGLNNIKFNE